MAITATIVPGKQWGKDELVTYDGLNQMNAFTVSLNGTIGGLDVALEAITPSKVKQGSYFYASGSAYDSATNTYNITFVPWTTPAFAVGLVVVFRATAANTGSGPTMVNVNGTGAREIFKHRGLALEVNDIRNNQMVELRADGTAYQLISHAGNPALLYLGDTAGSNTYTVNPQNGGGAAVTSLSQLVGRPVWLKVGAANTGVSTLQISALAAVPIRKNGAAELSAGDFAAGLMVCLIYDGAVFQVQSPLAAPPSSGFIVGQSRNLIIKPGLADPLRTITITADDVVLRDTAARHLLAANCNFTVAFGTAPNQVNGQDGTSYPLNAWMYVWVISDGLNVGGYVSVQPVSPGLPAGYTYKALVGVVRINGAADVEPFVQVGRQISQQPKTVFTAKSPLVLNTYEILASTDLTNFNAAVPPIAKAWFGTIGVTTAGAEIAVAVDETGIGAVLFLAAAHGSVMDTFMTSTPVVMPLFGGNLAWKSSSLTAKNRLTVSGFEL